MFRTGVPWFGNQLKPEAFDVSWADGFQFHSGDLGMVYVTPEGSYWQIFQNVDGAGVSGTNITGGCLGYVKNYAGYQVTPTIGNSSVNEVAGAYELPVVQNNYCAMRQGGTRKVKAQAGTYARGTPLFAAASANAVAAGNGVLTGNLAALDTGGGVLSLVNPFGEAVYVDRLHIVTTVKSTGASTTDAGVTATSATTSTDNLIDGLDTGAAVVDVDNFTNPGTNGKTRQLWPSGAWITASKASGAEAGLVGTYEVYYTRINNGGRQLLGVAQGARDGDGNVSAKLKIIPA